MTMLAGTYYRFNVTSHLHASMSDTTREYEWYSSRVRVALLMSFKFLESSSYYVAASYINSAS